MQILQQAVLRGASARASDRFSSCWFFLEAHATCLAAFCGVSLARIKCHLQAELPAAEPPRTLCGINSDPAATDCAPSKMA